MAILRSPPWSSEVYKAALHSLNLRYWRRFFPSICTCIIELYMESAQRGRAQVLACADVVLEYDKSGHMTVGARTE